jgi:arylsulfatase A-like enzyme/uncharacterized membrane protein YbhN (UPF0104 family)
MAEREPIDPTVSSDPSPPTKRGWTWKRIALLTAKVVFSAVMLTYVVQKVVSRDGADELWTQLGNLDWGWWFAAVAMQLAAIVAATTRWRVLLKGQGIHAPWRFLAPSFMIGRFWGAFTPGGLGLDGWRLYDVATRTGKVARPTALFGVEKVLGQLALGLVVMGSSYWGLVLLGVEGVLAVNAFFALLVTVGLTLLARPNVFRPLVKVIPRVARDPVGRLIEAVCAYHGKVGLLLRAAMLGVLVHSFNNLIYVCAARALGIEVTPMVLFFGAALQTVPSVLPVSINGLGLREAVAVVLYPAVGLSLTQALLIPIVGLAAEYAVSIFGVIPFIFRKPGKAGIIVDDPDRERPLPHAVDPPPADQWPKPLRGLTIGLGAGLLAGVLVGLGEALVVVTSAGGRTGLGVLSYGATSYAVFGGVGGAVLGLVLALSGRWMKREAMPEPAAYARITGFLVAFLAFAIGAFRIRRDVFQEELVWKSGGGILVLLGCAAAAVVLYLALSAGLRWLLSRRPLRVMLRAWGSPVVLGGIVAALTLLTLLFGGPAEASRGRNRPDPAPEASNILFIVVDTLRADHLPAYGYAGGSTPHLDTFAEDAIRFDQAFANASWTRPSFASILTGRYPSSHGVMAKPDQLPDALATLPEALQEGGYYSAGFMTNFNVAPYFNFQQGFDDFAYLEPDFVLGADDSAAKLLLIQFMRQSIEKLRAWRGTVEPGTAYQDAERVNREVRGWLDHAPRAPWFLFVGYMDTHDPYYVHPYDGTGFGRAAHQHPDLDQAPRMRALYDGEITYWDAQFGLLVQDLKRRGLYDDLTIIVTSDHGEEFGDHGGFWHGTTLYDEQLRVPLFVKLPAGRRAGTVVRHWVQSIDFMPTLLAEVGLQVPAGVQGGSLFDGTDRVYAEESHEGNVLESIRERRGTDELKLIFANEGNPRGLEAAELYRVDVDSAEQNDIARTEDAELRTMAGFLDEARQASRQGAVERQTVDVDGDAAQRLEALGYVQGD